MTWKAPEKYSKDQQCVAKLVNELIDKIVDETVKRGGNDADVYDLLNVAKLEIKSALLCAKMALSQITKAGRIEASGFKIVPKPGSKE